MKKGTMPAAMAPRLGRRSTWRFTGIGFSAMALAALLSLAYATSRTQILCRGFLPPNGMKIPVGGIGALSVGPDGRPGGLDEAAYNRVLDRVQDVYGPIVAAHGGHLVIDRLWTNADVNSDARRRRGDWILDIFGGIARYRTMTPEGFALVACHELGHQLGGYPHVHGWLIRLFNGNWASNEGEADYYATLKCLRRVLPATMPADADPTVLKACAEVWGKGSQEVQCVQDAMAAASVADLFQQLSQSAPIAFNTPDPTVARKTMDSHPPAQCRMDTYFQGTLCAQPVDDEVSKTDPQPGACTASQGFMVGLRPRCWYKPPRGEGFLPEVAMQGKLPSSRVLAEKLQSLRQGLIEQGDAAYAR